jgi:hypothetical protein
MIARLVRAFAARRRRKQYADVDQEWREVVAMLVRDRAQRRRWHVVRTVLLAGSLAIAAIVAVAVVTHAGALLR